MPIRWKLIIWIVLPLVGVYTLIVAADYSELKAGAYEQLESRIAERAGFYAARLNGQLDTAAQLARSTAAFLNAHPDLTEEDLYALVRSNVEQNPLVYGSCIAFEPALFAGRERFAPYAHRDGQAINAFDLSRNYDYADGTWEWYTLAAGRDDPIWTEPYFDKGGGEVIMCTYSAPFYRNGRPAGIATVDVRLEDLQEVVRTPGQQEGDFTILSRRGTVISHPDPDFIMRETFATIAAKQNRPDLEELGRRMIAGHRGALRVSDPATGAASLVSFAPIPSAGWSFSAAVPEEVALGPVHAQLQRRVGLMAMGLMLMVLVVLVAAIRIISPLRRLSAAVGELSSGNLRARVRGVGGLDEFGDLARAFNAMVEQVNAHVDALTRETAARESVESELRVARAIQSSLLPSTFPPFPDRTEFDLHALNAPARYVGGDFFDFFFAPGGRLTLVIADVAGKGVPAAMVMAVTRTLLRHLASGGASPAAALDAANRLLLEDNAQGVFVTLFVAQFDPATGEVLYANAGHPAPKRIDAHGNVAPFGRTTGPVLGVLDEATYAEHEERLAPGESLVLYTDGVTEARSPSGEFFGEARWESLLRAGAALDPRALCAAAVERLDAFQGEERYDDLTLLVLRRR